MPQIPKSLSSGTESPREKSWTLEKTISVARHGDRTPKCESPIWSNLLERSSKLIHPLGATIDPHIRVALTVGYIGGTGRRIIVSLLISFRLLRPSMQTRPRNPEVSEELCICSLVLASFSRETKTVP